MYCQDCGIKTESNSVGLCIECGLHTNAFSSDDEEETRIYTDDDSGTTTPAIEGYEDDI